MFEAEPLLQDESAAVQRLQVAATCYCAMLGPALPHSHLRSKSTCVNSDAGIHYAQLTVYRDELLCLRFAFSSYQRKTACPALILHANLDRSFSNV